MTAPGSGWRRPCRAPGSCPAARWWPPPAPAWAAAASSGPRRPAGRSGLPCRAACARPPRRCGPACRAAAPRRPAPARESCPSRRSPGRRPRSGPAPPRPRRAAGGRRPPGSGRPGPGRTGARRPRVGDELAPGQRAPDGRWSATGCGVHDRKVAGSTASRFSPVPETLTAPASTTIAFWTCASSDSAKRVRLGTVPRATASTRGGVEVTPAPPWPKSLTGAVVGTSLSSAGSAAGVPAAAAPRMPSRAGPRP